MPPSSSSASAMTALGSSDPATPSGYAPHALRRHAVRRETRARSRVRRPMSGEPWLILPTYNEAENVEAIVTAAGGVLADAAADGFRVLVVDAGSPDGTGAIADRLAAEHDWVEVLHRAEKNGIGPAYLAGFRHALDRDAGFLMEMDSDFSHDPADLARLLGAGPAGADLALGSRYVPGGGVSDWGLLRRLV